eukprot:CAMPEP_0205820812 /NCGR_PEP_ID=MMETSP0206-20130828/3490_1 /ASSEMBLY_ACC=CAM_ASM_000279 /TAXON_ID=36767 /ORGANISM="Euplotes focardii, Strain TN1" /LENGTH=215 /DNA_ID=CAMNT_0053115877 /DNA_START=119 /DNA_END=763 /DNA_ORIENTATION=+
MNPVYPAKNKKIRYGNLQLCYLKEGDEMIKTELEKQEINDPIDEFELVETDEFENEDYKQFEKKSKEELRSSTSSSAIGRFWDKNVLFQSNYFNDPSQQSPTNKNPRPSNEIKINNSTTSKTSKNDDFTDKKISSFLSSNSSISSSTTSEPEEMIGTLYFLDYKTSNLKPLSPSLTLPSKRRLSAQGTIEMPNPFLQNSVVTKNLKEQYFNEERW